jgi:HK97 family phage prohead protease
MSAPPREGLIRAVHQPIEVRAAGAGEPARLAGHFAVFNTWTEIASAWEGNFLERIAPGAFRKTIRENGDNIKLLLEHGQDPTVGQKPLGRFTSITEDETGARYTADLYDTEYVNQLLPALRDGMYGASFRFRVIREDVNEDPGVSEHNPKGLPERTIREASVAEAGPVLWGAYPDATSQARSLTDEHLFRRFMDLSPDRLREIADYWESRDHAEAQEAVDGPCDLCVAALDATPGATGPLGHCEDCDRAAQRAGVIDAPETRDVEDAGHLAQALSCLAEYMAEADEPADAEAVQRIATELAALISAEVAEPEDDSDDEMNSSAPEATEARAAQQHPQTTPDIWSTSTRPYHLSIRKESSWKLTSP